jgi:hypothetical protein
MNCNQTQTAEGVGGMLNLPQRKGEGKELSVNKYRKGSED